jgi:hypothetical protein
MKTAMMAVAEITSNDTANTSTAAEVGNGAGCREEGGGGGGFVSSGRCKSRSVVK